MTPREQLIAWLNDAYGTEMSLIPVLENHAKDAENYPEIHERLTRHVAETRRQAERLEGLITALGGSISTVKSTLGSLFGTAQSVSTGLFRDELSKNFLADYAAEHFEIASYKALIAAAGHVGEQAIVPTLEESLREEEAMARWIEERLPVAVRESLNATANAAGRS